MKLKYILCVIAAAAITKSSFAQYSQDAIRFSGTQPGSTARLKAVGNASTALGGDLSSVSSNPAGLGFFTSSEFSITPEYDMFKADAGYFGSNINSTKNTGNLSNASIVFYSQNKTARGTDKTQGWLSVNFGLGYSRTNNFNESVNYSGFNPDNSISDYYADRANFSSSDILADWAYDHKLIDLYNVSGGQSYLSNVVINNSSQLLQVGDIRRTGGQSEFNLAVGANYSNKLYIGGSLGIASIRYNSTTTFTETGDVSISDTEPARGFTSAFVQDQVTRGTGANIKLGVIYKPVNALRLGLNFTSPTWYSMEDTYTERLATDINGDINARDGETYGLRYDMQTPLKIAGGAAVFIGKYGFITGDIEYVDYPSANLESNDDYDASFDNGNIKTLYKGAVNARVGAEARLGKFAYLRGGYNIQGSPLKNDGSALKTASGGIGFRKGAYGIDATYTHMTGDQVLYPYEIGDFSPAATINRTRDNVYLTLSYRF